LPSYAGGNSVPQSPRLHHLNQSGTPCPHITGESNAHSQQPPRHLNHPTPWHMAQRSHQARGRAVLVPIPRRDQPVHHNRIPLAQTKTLKSSKKSVSTSLYYTVPRKRQRNPLIYKTNQPN
jgi:hypothetical protein